MSRTAPREQIALPEAPPPLSARDVDPNAMGKTELLTHRACLPPTWTQLPPRAFDKAPPCPGGPRALYIEKNLPWDGSPRPWVPTADLERAKGQQRPSLLEEAEPGAANLNALFNNFAVKSVKKGSFDDQARANVEMDLQEYSKFTVEFEIVPLFLSVAEATEVFRGANAGTDADDDRTSLNRSEFAVCVKQMVTLALKRYDTNSDGSISLKEAREGHMPQGLIRLITILKLFSGAQSQESAGSTEGDCAAASCLDGGNGGKPHVLPQSGGQDPVRGYHTASGDHRIASVLDKETAVHPHQTYVENAQAATLKLQISNAVLYNPLAPPTARRQLGRHSGHLPTHDEDVERCEVLKDSRTPRIFRDPDITLKAAFAGPYQEPHPWGRANAQLKRDYLDGPQDTRMKSVMPENYDSALARLAREDAATGMMWEPNDKYRLVKNTQEPRFLEQGKKEDNIFCTPSSGLQFQIREAKRRLAAAGEFRDKTEQDFSPHKAPANAPPYLPPSSKARRMKTFDPSRTNFKLRHKAAEPARQVGGGGIHITNLTNRQDEVEAASRPKTTR